MTIDHSVDGTRYEDEVIIDRFADNLRDEPSRDRSEPAAEPVAPTEPTAPADAVGEPSTNGKATAERLVPVLLAAVVLLLVWRRRRREE